MKHSERLMDLYYVSHLGSVIKDTSNNEKREQSNSKTNN